jgi:hypothetical protein
MKVVFEVMMLGGDQVLGKYGTYEAALGHIQNAIGEYKTGESNPEVPPQFYIRKIFTV